MVRMQVAHLVDLAPFTMPLILHLVLHQLEALYHSFHTVAEDSVAGLDLLASQLFLVKILVACLFRQWRSTNDSLRPQPPAATAAAGGGGGGGGSPDDAGLSPTGAPVSGEEWDDPMPLDDALARRALALMTGYLRHAAAREDTGLFIDPAMLDAPKPQAASKGASSRGRDALQRLGGRAGKKEDDAEAKENEREDRLFDGPHLLLMGGGAPLFSLLPSFPPSLTPFGPGVPRLPDQEDTTSPQFNRAWMDPTPPLGDTSAEAASRGDLDTRPSLVASLSRHAAQVVFYLSSSNWGVVHGLIHQRLNLLAAQNRAGGTGAGTGVGSGSAPILSPEDAALAASDLRLLESINATKSRLGVVLAELNTLFIHLRRPAQIVTAVSLRRMIWSFIFYRPGDFASLYASNRRLDGGPDTLFDHVFAAAESHAGGKRRAALWPLLSALLALCPDLVARLAAGEGRKLAVAGAGKKHAYYDALRKQLRQGPSKPASPPDAPVHAAVDLVVAAAYARSSDASLRLVVPDLEPELRDRVFTPLRLAAGAGGARADEVTLASELLAALYALDPARTAAEIIPGCLADKSTISAKMMLAKAALRIHMGPGKASWKPSLSSLYQLIALPLRHMFKDTAHSILRQTSSSGGMGNGAGTGAGAVARPNSSLSPSPSTASLATATTVTAGGKLSFSRGSVSATQTSLSPTTAGGGAANGAAAADPPAKKMELLVHILHLWQADFHLCTYGMTKDHRPRPPPEVRAPWVHDSFWADLRNVDTPLSLVWTVAYAVQAHGWEKVAPAALGLLLLPVWKPGSTASPSASTPQLEAKSSSNNVPAAAGSMGTGAGAGAGAVSASAAAAAAVTGKNLYYPWFAAAREAVAPYVLLAFYERILWAESAYTRRLYISLAQAVLLARLRFPTVGETAATGPTGGVPIGPTAATAALAAREAIQAAEAVEAEVAILLTLCSAETDISHGAAQLGDLIVQISQAHPDSTIPLPAPWKAFYLQAAQVSSPFAGRVAQQRNVRKALCDVLLPDSPAAAAAAGAVAGAAGSKHGALVATLGAKGAWAEAYRRWGTLTQIVARPMAADMSDTAQDKAAYWHNLTAFLAVLGGAVSHPFTTSSVTGPGHAGSLVPASGAEASLASMNALVSPKLLAALDEPETITLVDTYVQEMVDLLVSDSLWVRDKVKITLGQDLGVRLAVHLLKQVHIVLSEFFDKSTGLPRPSDMFTVFIEQSISVVEKMLGRMPFLSTSSSPQDSAQASAAAATSAGTGQDFEGGEGDKDPNATPGENGGNTGNGSGNGGGGAPEPLRVDIGSLMVLYVEYANALGKKEQPLRIKLAVAKLCATLLKHKASFAFSNESHVRNRLFQALVTWTSESVCAKYLLFRQSFDPIPTLLGLIICRYILL